MPYFDSPPFYIDFSKVAPPAVIETVDYEAILARYKANVLAAKPDLARALSLEQSAANIILEAEADGEMIVRARINAAARAVMLAFATGTDLDALAVLYNVVRLTNTDGSKETDDRFRRRVQMAAEAFSTAGSRGAYEFHALTADPSIRDVSATRRNGNGGVTIAVMNSAADPTPTATQISNVFTYLNRPNIRPLTDVVSVVAPTIVKTTIVANVTLYDGPDQSIVAGAINAALTNLRNKIARLGMSLERAAVISACYQEGVQNVELISPALDINVQGDGCVFVSAASFSILNQRRS